MSNKIVVYRSVIDDVISNIRSEFDEYGVSEDVLADLQNRWESKIIASKVAEFEPEPRQNTNAHDSNSTSQPSIPSLQASFPPPPPPPHPVHYPHPHPHPHFPPPSSHNQYQNNGPLPPISIKTESGEPPRYPPPPPGQAMHLQTYVLPHPLHTHPSSHPNQPAGSESVLQFQQRPPPPPAPQYSPQSQSQSHHPAPSSQVAQQSQPIPRRAGGPPPWTRSPPRRDNMPKIPQFDGAASTSSNSSNTPPPGAGMPGSSQPRTTGASEEINSDLDDSESEGEGAEETETGGPEQDIVFCTYDKVARVKNKWKCVLKDGMVHINGKDYLFSKCTGEFEW